MSIVIPKIRRALPLSEYAPEFGEEKIEVWVNPPRALMLEWARMAELLREVGKTANDLTPSPSPERRGEQSTPPQPSTSPQPSTPSPDLSQPTSPQPSPEGEGVRIEELERQMRGVLSQLWGWSEEEVEALRKTSIDTDPGLMGWLIGRTFALITEHRVGIKKK